MDPENLAGKLADSLNDIVPEPFRVYGEHAMVFTEGGGYREASEVGEIIDQEGDILELARIVALDALSTIQDHIVQKLTTPWPGDSSALPIPRVKVGEDTIDMWFEDRAGNRVFSAPPIPW